NAEYNNKTNNININGSNMEECMELEPSSLMLAGWWRVFHQSTEYLITGIFTNPIIAIIFETLLALSYGLINLWARI
mgnify:CR=1